MRICCVSMHILSPVVVKINYCNGQSLDLKDLMDRAVQLSDKLHFLSASLKNDLVSICTIYYMYYMRNTPPKHSGWITCQSPLDLSQLLVGSVELITVIPTTMDPLLALSSDSLPFAHPYKNRLSTKARQLHEHSDSLSTGLKTLADRMGTSSSSHSPIAYNKKLGEDIESQTVNFHFLLSCFRRDSHKIDNFLKILRCKADILQQACQ
uniref:Prolactin n=1 Tax=Paramormyrops kingsleyae TaxID=1676925 RepID=A0A3B3RXU8_9TELE